jgi:hypothetical protein
MASRSWRSTDGRAACARRIAVWLPTALLAIVAAAQMTLARLDTLSAWKGGGFGMFASLDGLAFREVRLFTSANDRTREIPLPEVLGDAAARVAAYPHVRAMRTFAAEVMAQERAHGHAIDAVRVEVWRTRLSPALDSTRERLCDISVDAETSSAWARR